MGIEYYVFALFIAVLVCVVAIIFKVLFSDVKRRSQMLDEREKKLFELYNSAETIFEEWTDQAKAATDEQKRLEQECRSAIHNMAAFELPEELIKKEQAIEKVPRSVPLDANRIRIAGDVIERAERTIVPESRVPEVVVETKPVFQRFFDDALEAPPPTPYSPAQVSGGSRRDSILALAEEGKTDVEIASKLGITRNEVRLVVGLTSGR